MQLVMYLDCKAAQGPGHWEIKREDLWFTTKVVKRLQSVHFLDNNRVLSKQVNSRSYNYERKVVRIKTRQLELWC